MKVVFPTRLLAPRYRDIDAKDVRFRDYDGAIVASMTVPEARALEALPALPSHPGLVAQGWNWSLDELHNLTHPADVGAHFITDDGKTRLYMVIPAGDTNPVPLEISYNGKLHVDWGDGSEPFVEEPEWELEEDELYPTWQLSHTYPTTDKDAQYVITVWSEGGSVRFGQSDWDWGNYNIFGEYSSSEWDYYNRLKLVEFGKITGSYRNGVFMGCTGLQTVTMPKEVTTFEAGVFCYCKAIRYVTIPSGTESLVGSTFAYSALKNISLPKSLMRLEACVFRFCQSLERVCPNAGTTLAGSTSFDGTGISFLRVPEGVTSLPSQFVTSCKKLERIVIPRGVKTIGNSAFSECGSLLEIDIPEGVTELPEWCFHNSKALRRISLPSTLTTVKGYGLCTDAETGTTVLDFRSARQIPTLTDEYGVTRAAKIIVPDDLYESWITADIWKNAASVIVKASEA